VGYPWEIEQERSMKSMATAHLSYLAIISERPETLADFYRTYFGLSELDRSLAGDISMTDGFFNLTFFKRRADLGESDDSVGAHHFGLAIDDIREIEARLKEFAPNADLQPENGDLHHGEYRVFDPNGYPVSLSTKHFGVTPRPRGFPSIHHIATSVPNRDEVVSFYVNVFGFQETSVSIGYRERNHPARHVGDGITNLAILPDPDLMRQLGEEREVGEQNMAINTKAGVAHFGFVVPDMEALMQRLPPELAGLTNQRPSRRYMAEYRVFDPERNGIDLSQHLGFEVGFNTWVRAE
jgi:catechol 2,3-dioxygenase-like lactoylglutathione lyase family enzyme